MLASNHTAFAKHAGIAVIDQLLFAGAHRYLAPLSPAKPITITIAAPRIHESSEQ
jgi:hypothetical protein